MNKDSLGDAWYQISPWYGFPSFLDLRFVPVLLTPTASDNNKWTGSVDNDNYTGLICWIRESAMPGVGDTLISEARSHF